MLILLLYLRQCSGYADWVECVPCSSETTTLQIVSLLTFVTHSEILIQTPWWDRKSVLISEVSLEWQEPLFGKKRY